MDTKIKLKGGIHPALKDAIIMLFPNVEWNNKNGFEAFDKTKNFTFRMKIYEYTKNKVKINIYVKDYSNLPKEKRIEIIYSDDINLTENYLAKALISMWELGIKEWFKENYNEMN